MPTVIATTAKPNRLWRYLRRTYLQIRVNLIEADTALDRRMLAHLPDRIAAHDRVAGELRAEIIQLQD